MKKRDCKLLNWDSVRVKRPVVLTNTIAVKDVRDSVKMTEGLK